MKKLVLVSTFFFCWGGTADMQASGTSLIVPLDNIKVIPLKETDPPSETCPEPTDFSTVTSTNGRIWLDRNLGASWAATAIDDVCAYGDLYQWGREEDGHEKRTSTTTTTLSTSEKPGHDKFIVAAESPYDWINTRNDTLWQGTGGVNNPCPVGFRLPTSEEFTAEMNSWDTQDAAGAFASPLKLAMAGQRNHGDGNLANEDSRGSYYTSTIGSSSNITYYYFTDTGTGSSASHRAMGMSVRCIKDEKTVFITSETYVGGEIGGLTGGDSICQNHAEAAGLSGIYKAWLSDSQDSPKTRMTQSTVPYKLIDGTVIADSWTHLTTGPLSGAIKIAEDGTVLTNQGVWTGTLADGTAHANTCGDWNDTNLTGVFGASTYTVHEHWTAFLSTGPCTDKKHLYCFEQ